MIIDLETGKFEFLENYNVEKIKAASLGLSGGTDSAALLYLLCLAIPHAKIVCYCGVENLNPNPVLRRPTNVWYAEEIFNAMKEKFPNVDLVFESFSFDRYDQVFVKKAKEIYDNAEDKSTLPNFNGLLKIMAVEDPVNEIRDRYNIDTWFTGLTSNPPLEDQKRFGFENTNMEPRRNIKGGNNINKPFINHDKKTIAAIFKKFNLMDDIFPLTQSCTSNCLDTDYFTKPCGKCYWCYEKLWAFGTMDIC